MARQSDVTYSVVDTVFPIPILYYLWFNKHDRYAAAIKVSGNIFGHVPHKFSKIVYYFIKWVFQSTLRTSRSNNFGTVMWSTNRAFFKPSCNGLDLRKNYILIVEGNKTEIPYFLE